MAGVVLALALALTACSTPAEPAAPATPRAPAPVRSSWPGCAALGAFHDERGEGPSGVGGVPAGFTPTAVVLCQDGERQNAAGDTVAVDLERSSPDVGPLLTYLARPDEPSTDGACPAIGFVTPWMFLLDGSGRYVAPAIPRDACGLPLGWQGERSAWDLPVYTDRVVGEGGVRESAAAKRAGCAMGWKDMVDAYATSSQRRSGRFANDLPRGSTLRVCIFEVPAADRGTDAPAGDFVEGRTLDDREQAAFRAGLRASPETPARCPSANRQFATVAPADGGPVVYVELDGCRRAVSDGETTPVVRVGDDLVALLGG